MSTITSTPCKQCGNTFFESFLTTLECTNCLATKKRATRTAKAFIVYAVDDNNFLPTMVLTSLGWLELGSQAANNAKKYHKRKSANLNNLINNPPHGYAVEVVNLNC